MTFVKKLFAASVLAATSVGAHAALILDPMDIDAPRIVETFDGVGAGFVGGASLNFNPDFTLSSIGFPAADLQVGDPGVWNLGGNGVWSLGKEFAGANTPVGALAFTFAPGTFVSGIGAFVNYFIPAISSGTVITLTALGADGMVLESYGVAISTPDAYNDGSFLGIQRAQADIASFVVSGAYVVADDLTYSKPIPEPSTWAMLGTGLA
ncbi:MAG: hypothetical protein MUF30_07270, partial [Burkholderiales bacterium]|nr:hypothetical protein [Burkholderiales bacterium]